MLFSCKDIHVLSISLFFTLLHFIHSFFTFFRQFQFDHIHKRCPYSSFLVWYANRIKERRYYFVIFISIGYLICEAKVYKRETDTERGRIQQQKIRSRLNKTLRWETRSTAGIKIAKTTEKEKHFLHAWIVVQCFDTLSIFVYFYHFGCCCFVSKCLYVFLFLLLFCFVLYLLLLLLPFLLKRQLIFCKRHRLAKNKIK